MPTDAEVESGTPSTSVTTDDFKAFQESMKSSVALEMEKMREMIAQLLQAKGTPPPNVEEPIPSKEEEASAKAKAEAKAKAAEEGLGTEETSGSTKPNENKEYKETPWFSPDPPIPHPHINHRGDPPKLTDHSFEQWQYLMKSHVQSSCIDLWAIIVNGLHVNNPSNLTRREVVDSQLNATAKHMIQLGVGSKNMPHIQHLDTAKECWDTLIDIFVGNESMRRNRYEALNNQAEGFYMLDGEDHEDMYRRLKAIANTFRDHGVTHVDDAWIKRKYVSALMPFEPTDLKEFARKAQLPSHDFQSSHARDGCFQGCLQKCRRCLSSCHWDAQRWKSCLEGQGGDKRV